MRIEYGYFYFKFVWIVEIIFFFFMLNVWFERGVSVVKRVKSRFYSSMIYQMLEALLYIFINGQFVIVVEDFVKEVVVVWSNVEKRRKFSLFVNLGGIFFGNLQSEV